MAATTFGFDGHHLEFKESADVGQCGQTRIGVGHGRKYEGRTVEAEIAASSLTVQN